VGSFVLYSPDAEARYPFQQRVRDLVFPNLRWLDAQGRANDDFPELKGSAVLSMEGNAKVFEGSGKSPEEIYAAAKEGRPGTVLLGVSAKMRTVTKHEEVRSMNVAACLRGSDAKLRDEYVVYSAHLDHLGIGEAVNGDKIYNGALDNASGTATMLEVARAFSGMKERPKRSILFVSVTGEEEGLLGSDYFAHYPTVPKGSLVANINTDGNGALLWPVENVIARGAEHSTLS
jgi:Zn-dependent M28 family amino/carboxypeptidase